MKKYALFILFLLVPLVQAAWYDDVTAGYEFNDGGFDVLEVNNLTAYGAAGISAVLPKLGNGTFYETTQGNYTRFGTSGIFSAGCSTCNVSSSFWVNMTSVASPILFWDYDYVGGTGRGLSVLLISSNVLRFSLYGVANDMTIPAFSANTWYHVATVKENNVYEIYIDGVNVVNKSLATTPTYNSTGRLRVGSDGSNYLKGHIDSLMFFDRALTAAEVLEIYNNGTGTEYPAGGAGVSFATVSVKDMYDNTSLSGLTVYIGSASNVTDGSGEATVYNPTGLNFSVDGGTNYFNTTGTATENATTNAYIYGALLDFSPYNVEGTNLLSFNISSPSQTNTSVNGSSVLLLRPNATLPVNVSVAGYYLGQYNVTTGSQDTSSQNLTGLYQTILTINATNAYTGMVLSNWTGWLYNNDTGYNTTYNTTGNSSTLYVINGTHTAYIDVYDYSISADNFEQANFTNLTETITFNLYSENSINIFIFDQDTGTPIYENITVTISGNSTEDIYYTTNSTLFVENLTDGDYSVKFNGENYTQATYTVTVADRSSQTLNAYLAAGSDTVIFTVLDYDSAQPIEGASIIQERLINASWTTVSSKNSDITGRAQFAYTIGVKYRFTVSYTGYETKIFELDPIIFTSYNIRIQQNLGVDEDIGLFDVTFFYNPKFLINEENNTFLFNFNSVGGTLESYGFTLVYPGGSIGDAGVNANGESFNSAPFLVTGAAYGDYANLTYWYDSTLGGNKTYSMQLSIQGAANNNTAYSLVNNDYGLGTIEKILIATVITILVAGILTLYGSSVVGLIGGLIILGFFIYIDFVSIWVAITTFVIGLLILMRRSGE